MQNDLEREIYFKPYNLETLSSLPFYAMPKILIEDIFFKDLSGDAKLLYMVMQNRVTLSQQNNWADENGDVYIHMVLDEIQDTLHCSREKAVNMMKQLKDIGLIETKRQGQGKPNKIYVNEISNYKKFENKTSDYKKFENRTSKNSDTIFPEVRKSNGSNTDISNKDLVIKSNYINIITMYNDTCVSLPKVLKISSSREKAIKARLKKYSIDDFKKLFELAEASDFLKGSNDRNWVADFDWLIKDNNFIKTLEGKYNNKSTTGDKLNNSPNNQPKNKWANLKEVETREIVEFFRSTEKIASLTDEELQEIDEEAMSRIDMYCIKNLLLEKERRGLPTKLLPKSNENIFKSNENASKSNENSSGV